MKLCREETRAIFWQAVADHPTIFPKKFAIAYDGAHHAIHADASRPGPVLMDMKRYGRCRVR